MAEDDLNELKHMTQPLENHEHDLVRSYGMMGNIDSVEVLNMMKAQQDSESILMLSKLLDNCTKIDEIERHHSMRAPHPSSVTYVTVRLFFCVLTLVLTDIQGSQNKFSIDGSQTWAVLIGIDSYNNPMSLLQRCVRDALDM